MINLKKRLKARFWPKKQSSDKAVDEPLLTKIAVHQIKTTQKTQICNTATADLSEMHPDQISAEVEVNGNEVLSMLEKILNEQSNSQDLDSVFVMMKTWVKQNGVTMEKKEGIYPQDWLHDFQKLIDQSLEDNFPILPTDETQTSEKLQEFLKRAENMICSEVCRLTPVLKDAGLLSYLIQSYSHQLFTKLDLLINRNISVDDTFCLLLWGKRVFFSLDPQDQDAFRVQDPLMLSGWFERAKLKLLTVLRDDISRPLQNILCYEEKDEDKERPMSDECFIKVHFDVTQCLAAVIQNAKKYSQTLMNSVQILCLEELHNFAKKYVNREKQRLKNFQSFKLSNLVYLCRIISTCMELRCFAVKICNQDKCETADILNTMKDHVMSIVQKMIENVAKVSLRSYFKNGDEHIDNLTEEIRKECSSLPEAAKETKTIIVNLAYGCVSRVYLDCLMKSKFIRLERRWGNVDEKITQDIEHFHDKFGQLNGSDDQNQLLSKMTEVLFIRDVDALKLTCGFLFKEFPDDSKKYLPGLLRWKRTLSKQQMREVLEVGQMGYSNAACDNWPLTCIFCCPCC